MVTIDEHLRAAALAGNADAVRRSLVGQSLAGHSPAGVITAVLWLW